MAKNSVFNIFPCNARAWCARRADGLVSGTFVDQAGAVRFAKREIGGSGAIIIRSAGAPEIVRVRAA